MSGPLGDCDSDRGRVQAELEALEAIYGDTSVAYDATAGSVAVELSPRLSFSCLLPVNYPSVARPRNPTIRAAGLSRKDAAMIVEEATARAHEDTDVGTEILFQYCQQVQDSCDAAEVDGHDDGERSASPAAGSAGPGAEPRYVCFGEGSSVIHGEPVTSKKSVFQAHAARVHSVQNARDFTGYLLSAFPKLASATHHIMAYRIGPAQDFDDDGEHGAGKGLLFTLQQMDVDFVVVVVSRWFGGTKLGPLRFKMVNNAARTLLTDQYSKLG